MKTGAREFLPDEDATLAYAEVVRPLLRPGVLVFLRGELGAGKTTLVRGILRQFGHTGSVKSPTYTLVEPYETKFGPVYHFDFYRLDTPEEVLDIGFEDYLSSDNRCFMEWPEKIGPYLPPESLKVFIEVQPDNSRIILLENPSMA